jgi:hypothetical protein
MGTAHVHTAYIPTCLNTPEVQTLINRQTLVGLKVNWSSELAELTETEMVGRSFVKFSSMQLMKNFAAALRLCTQT